MSLLWGGKLDSKLSVLTSLVTKINYANMYGRLKYNPKTYPSPVLSPEEWEIVYKIIGERLGLIAEPENYKGECWILDPEYESGLSRRWKRILFDRYADRPTYFNGADEIVEYDQSKEQKEATENIIATWTYRWDRKNFERLYMNESYTNTSTFAYADGIEDSRQYYVNDVEMVDGKESFYQGKAMPNYVIHRLRELITTLSNIGEIDANLNDVEVIDRMEEAIVTTKEGFKIDTRTQLDNLFRYYADDKSSSYTIYYDAKTMLPLVYVKDDRIVNSDFRLKIGTRYLKWTRTVKYKEYNNDSILGRSFTIDADTFPEDYRIECETNIRDQVTGKDQRFKIIIFRANISSDTSITLQADGDPTVFTMDIDVLTPENGILMDMQLIEVEEDKYEGGTHIVPQKSTYSFTPAVADERKDIPSENNEIY